MFGQLGNGATSSQRTPVNVTGLGSGVVAVSAGDSHTCALTKDGRISCFGDGSAGQLGTGAQQSSNVPDEVSGLGAPATAVSAGEQHTCASLEGRGLVCWGANYGGQLGDGTTTERFVPTPTAPPVPSAAASDAFVVVETSGGFKGALKLKLQVSGDYGGVCAC